MLVQWDSNLNSIENNTFSNQICQSVSICSLTPSDFKMKQLVWSGRRDGLIELEVTMRDGSKCHEGSINQLVAGEDGELVTIGKSGFWV